MSMLQQNSQDLTAWKNQMKAYQKQKRTKKPFGPQIPHTEHITHRHIKQKQAIFNPVLQVYNDPANEIRRTDQDEFLRAKSLMNHIRQTKKYERPFDIVNLHSGEEGKGSGPELNPKKLGPIRNAYNVINNTKLPDFYFQNRQIKLPIEREKTLINNNPKQFNIVTGVYYKDNQQRTRQQEQQEKQNSLNKYWKTHEYDPVFGKYYDTQKQQHYQQTRKQQQKQHGKDFDSKLPPSYHLPESLQTIDEKRMNAKKRYQLKYYIQDEYNKRNLEEEDKQEQIVRNRVHNGRIEEHKAKEFDIITMKQYEPTRAEELFNKKNVKSTWEKLQQSQTQGQGQRTGQSFGSGFGDSSKIKSGGFN